MSSSVKVGFDEVMVFLPISESEVQPFEQAAAGSSATLLSPDGENKLLTIGQAALRLRTTQLMHNIMVAGG